MICRRQEEAGISLQETDCNRRSFPLAESAEFVKVFENEREGRDEGSGNFRKPAKKGNTEALLKEFLRGFRDAKAEAEEIYSGFENYSVLGFMPGRKDGKCPIRDDMARFVRERLSTRKSSPSPRDFFLFGERPGKGLYDRCQAFWSKKYLFEAADRPGAGSPEGLFHFRRGLTGEKVFDGAS